MKNKKIGIITFHSAVNYGAVLQAFALQNVIKKMNDKCKIINYRNKHIEKPYKLWYMKLERNNIKHNIKTIISKIIYFPKNFARYKVFKNSINNMLDLTDAYYTEEELNNISSEFDTYIAGSDQIWNSDITGGLKDAYTLNFGKENIKRISYAASIGKNDIDDNEKYEYEKKIKKFDFISVREENAKRILEPVINKDIEVVLDPTFLLEKEEWESSIKECKNFNKKYILAYVVSPDEEYVKIVNYISKKMNLGVVHFGRKDIYDNVIKNAYTKGPLDFVNLVKNAEMVITTSFHATAFSIIFNKKFFVIPNKRTGTRVTDLLKKLNISSRAVRTLEEMKNKSFEENIDYNHVNKIMEEERQKSLNFLKRAIES